MDFEKYIRSRIGILTWLYSSFVWRTSRLAQSSMSLKAFRECIVRESPCIITTWHGRHLVMPLALPRELAIHILVAPNVGGDAYATAYERQGFPLIRGSGGIANDLPKKRGHLAFFRLKRALRDGCAVLMTADFPEHSREVSRGVTLLARTAGRPVLPVAVSMFPAIRLKTWDNLEIGFPFGLIRLDVGNAVWVGKGPFECQETREAVRTTLLQLHGQAQNRHHLPH